MGENLTHYREQSWAPLWVMALIWGGGVAAVIVTVRSLIQAMEIVGQPDEGMSWFTVLPVAGIGVVLLLLLGVTVAFMRLDIEVRGDHIFIAFGPVHLVRKRIRFSDIEAVRGLTYRPIVEFGGWGIKWRPSRTAWTIRGNQAAAVTLKSGKQIYVGSEHPQRLAGAIQAAMRGAGE